MTNGKEADDTVLETLQLVHLACWTHCRSYIIETLQSLHEDRPGPNPLAGHSKLPVRPGNDAMSLTHLIRQLAH